jgi:hypothetical protein
MSRLSECPLIEAKFFEALFEHKGDVHEFLCMRD